LKANNETAAKLNAAFQEAVALQKSGDVESAAAKYEALRSALPNHPELHYLLGAAYVHLNRLNDALSVLEHCLKQRPDHVPAMEMAGSAWVKLNRLDNAVPYFEKAARQSPTSAAAQCRLGSTLIATHRYEEARSAYQTALDIEPENAEAMTGLGFALHKMGKSIEAESLLRSCIDTTSYAQAHTVLAGLLDEEARFDEAEAVLRRCLAVHPNYLPALHSLAISIHKQGNLIEAEKAYRKAISAGVTGPDIAVQRTDALTDLGKLDEAAEILERAIATTPHHAGLMTGLGRVHELRGDLAHALKLHDRAIEADGRNVAALINRGNTKKYMGDLEGALTDFQTAASLDPASHAARASQGMVLLNLGRLKEGWPLFKSRGGARAGSVDLTDGKPWDGKPLDGKKILVWSEYGLGDEILFASLLPDALQRTATCTFVCSPRLAHLFKRAFPGADIRGPGPEVEGDFDARLPLVNAAQWLRPSLDAFPKHPGYLKADPELTKEMRSRYRAGHDGPVIGISWYSGGSIGTGPFKSLPLDKWLPILNSPNIRFVSLQYGNPTAEIKAIKTRFDFDLIEDSNVDPSGDMDAFAAQVASMDLVISVSNSTVHFAGALGIPVWAMVPKGLGAHWYWFQDRTDSPWYPSLTIYRQTTPGAWDNVINAIVNDLKSWRNS